MAGLNWYERFVEKVKSRKGNSTVTYSFQTNGILLDESWCNFFIENNFLLGLSIDADRKIHDSKRQTLSGEGSFDACMKAKELLDKTGVDYNILSVLTNELARESEKAFRFILRENIRYIQFIPCMEPGLTGSPHSSNVGSLRPALFAGFYTKLLPLWIKEYESGNYISIKFFDDTYNYFIKGSPNLCGINGNCNNQSVVEADGSVYPCDFYCFDEYHTGNLAESTIGELLDNEMAKRFLNDKPVLHSICTSCPYLNVCRGGCKRMRGIVYPAEGDSICGYRAFLEKCLLPLKYTVEKGTSDIQK